MKYDEETDIFEDVISIHPNMNNIILEEFNSERIQTLVKQNMFFGELWNPEANHDLARVLSISHDKITIQIISLHEEYDSLKIKFKFLNNPFSDVIKRRYMESYNSFIIRTRTLINHDKSILTLVTFDLIYSPPMYKNNYKRNKSNINRRR